MLRGLEIAYLPGNISESGRIRWTQLADRLLAVWIDSSLKILLVTA